jgi:hypothetical protein
VDEHPEPGVAVPLASREPLGRDGVRTLCEREEDYDGVEDSFKLNYPGNKFKRDAVY